MLEVKNLYFSVPDNNCGNKELFNNFNKTVETGCNSLILGASGRGKTTLLSLLAGMMKPERGSLLFDNKDLQSFSSKDITYFRTRQMGFVFQEPHLINHLTVYQNIEIITVLSNIEITRRFIEETLDQLNLLPIKNKKAVNISSGERQRVAIARAIVRMPKWILCDEPTSALDDKNTKDTLELLKNISNVNNTSLIIATHDSRVKDFFSIDKKTSIVDLDNYDSI